MAIRKSTAVRKSGTRSKGVSSSDVKGAMKLFDKLMAETEPAIPEGLVDEVERSMTGSGADAVHRRIALISLSRTFKVTAENIRDDREAAIALASAAALIKSSARKYRGLADLMDTAEVRIQIALCQREDMDAVLAEASHG